MATELGIGIVGGGRICGAHATAALALPETRLIGVAEVDPDRREAAVGRWGCAGYADLDAMLADDGVDAVVIALPHHLHAEAAIAALRAGRHVLIEKPLSRTVAEADAILTAADEAGVTLMVAHSQRFFPANIEACRLLREGAIGQPVIATDTWYKPFWEGVRPAWFLEAATGGGMWPMNGSHMLDRLCMFLDTRVASVSATVGSPVHRLSATDTGLAFVRMANGLCATIQHVGYSKGAFRFEAEITGTEGQLRLPGNAANGPIFRNDGSDGPGGWQELSVPVHMPELRRDAPPPTATFALQLREFAHAIRDSRVPTVSGDYGRHIVAALTACEESSRTGREIPVPA